MNPRHLFALTAAQRLQYSVQPDMFIQDGREQVTDEFELPPYMPDTHWRFWYNNQTVGYFTHWHDALELIMPLEEDYLITVRDTDYRLVPGDIMLIPPGDLHAIKAPQSGNRFIFLIDLGVFHQIGDFRQSRLLLSKPVHITSERFSAIYEEAVSMIMQAAALYWSSSPSRQLQIYACLLKFFACCIDHQVTSSISSDPNGNSPRSEQLYHRFNQLLDYLQLHYAENISLEQAADQMHLSKYYFTKVFKQYTGQTFYEYFSYLRIQAAEEYLKDPSIPIADISSSCGYVNISSFNRTFRKLKGCNPSEYRKLHSRKPAQPLTAPSVTPLTKYFCKNG